jgi:hypothetical protein
VIIKDQRLACKEDWYIKALDLVVIEVSDGFEMRTETYMVVPATMYNEAIHMINTEDGSMYDHETFNHPIHLHNHLLKHYGEYELVKSKDLEINLIGPMRKIKKGVKL